jgi:hypothetical protein
MVAASGKLVNEQIRNEAPLPVVELTSFCHPFDSFFSKPARIEATPKLYENSRE